MPSTESRRLQLSTGVQAWVVPSPHCWLVVLEPVDLREDEKRGQQEKRSEQRRIGLTNRRKQHRKEKDAQECRQLDEDVELVSNLAAALLWPP
jgi:hypothetical protein